MERNLSLSLSLSLSLFFVQFSSLIVGTLAFFILVFLTPLSICSTFYTFNSLLSWTRYVFVKLQHRNIKAKMPRKKKQSFRVMFSWGVGIELVTRCGFVAASTERRSPSMSDRKFNRMWRSLSVRIYRANALFAKLTDALYSSVLTCGDISI